MIVQSTRLFEFLRSIADAATAVTPSDPVKYRVEIAGPERIGMADFVRQVLASRPVASVPELTNSSNYGDRDAPPRLDDRG